jgi:hypothetical protein
MHQDCLIVAVVAQVFEEDAATEQRDLQRGEVNVGVEGTPSVCPYAVRYEGREEAIEVEEEEDGEDATYEQLNQEDPTDVSSAFETLAHLYTPIETGARVQRLWNN